MKLILDIVWEFWSAALQTLCAAVVFVTALVTAFSPIWLPLGACYYWQLEGWVALTAFGFGGLLLLFLLFAAAKAARGQ